MLGGYPDTVSAPPISDEESQLKKDMRGEEERFRNQ